ncbi:MAG TPA: hypothetical protein VGI39_35990, partial [Polyangiaceae bacterium]
MQPALLGRSPRRIALSILLAAALGGACIQNLDTGAASGGSAAAPAPIDPNLTTWQVCGAPSCDSPNGAVPVLLDTPVIYLPDGGTTSDPCDEVNVESRKLRQTYCAGCHEAPASQGGLGFILEDNQLATAFSQTALLPDGGPQRLVIPGDPYGSRLYQRVAAGVRATGGGMPPAPLAGSAATPRPTASDLSVL